jgi:serine/threonine protein kinase
MVGRTVSHYRILEKLGDGGMGRSVRPKTPGCTGFSLSSSCPRRWREIVRLSNVCSAKAEAASALNHPNICTIYEIDEFEGQPFIAMELLEGLCGSLPDTEQS